MAINRALELTQKKRQVWLVDLDTVEPFYTLRSLRQNFEAKGLNLIAFNRADSFGLGETGAMLNPRARWALINEGDVIFDIGYGAYGAQTLNLIEGVEECKELKVLAVVNFTRPMTNSLERIVEYINNLGRVDAIIANTHLGNETTPETIIEGNFKIIESARVMGLPVDYIAVEQRFKNDNLEKIFDVPVKYITRYMPGAMW